MLDRIGDFVQGVKMNPKSTEIDWKFYMDLVITFMEKEFKESEDMENMSIALRICLWINRDYEFTSKVPPELVYTREKFAFYAKKILSLNGIASHYFRNCPIDDDLGALHPTPWIGRLLSALRIRDVQPLAMVIPVLVATASLCPVSRISISYGWSDVINLFAIILGQSTSGKTQIMDIIEDLMNGSTNWLNEWAETMEYLFRFEHPMTSSYSGSSLIQELGIRGGRGLLLTDEQGAITKMLDINPGACGSYRMGSLTICSCTQHKKQTLLLKRCQILLKFTIHPKFQEHSRMGLMTRKFIIRVYVF